MRFLGEPAPHGIDQTRDLRAAGDESSVEEWCAELGALTGIEPYFRETFQTVAGLPLDTSRLSSLIGPVGRVSLKEGLKRMVSAPRPDLVKPQK
jgi:hypothetical protein